MSENPKIMTDKERWEDMLKRLEDRRKIVEAKILKEKLFIECAKAHINYDLHINDWDDYDLEIALGMSRGLYDFLKENGMEEEYHGWRVENKIFYGLQEASEKEDEKADR